MTPEEIDARFDALNRVIAEGRLLRGAWRRREGGVERLCLLAALSPEVADEESATACPVGLLPAWWAQLAPWLDDGVSDHVAVAQRWAEVTYRAVRVLNAETWQRLDYACRAIALREVLPYAGKSANLVEGVLVLCDRAAAGGRPTVAKWLALREVAARAAAAAAEVAEDATPETWPVANANAEAISAAAEVAAMTSTLAVVEAAASAARAAYARESGSVEAAEIAEAAAWDRIATAFLDAIEKACEGAS